MHGAGVVTVCTILSLFALVIVSHSNSADCKHVTGLSNPWTTTSSNHQNSCMLAASTSKQHADEHKLNCSLAYRSTTGQHRLIRQTDPIIIECTYQLKSLRIECHSTSCGLEVVAPTGQAWPPAQLEVPVACSAAAGRSQYDNMLDNDVPSMLVSLEPCDAHSQKMSC
eukprot:6460424-Amphidinium_carterae.1